jgi:hypothetical protein
VGILVNVRIQRVKSKSELESKATDYMAMGYKITKRQEESIEVWKRNYGGIMLHIILFFLSFCTFALNIIYIIYKYFSPEDAVLLKVENIE